MRRVVFVGLLFCLVACGGEERLSSEPSTSPVADRSATADLANPDLAPALYDGLRTVLIPAIHYSHEFAHLELWIASGGIIEHFQDYSGTAGVILYVKRVASILVQIGAGIDLLETFGDVGELLTDLLGEELTDLLTYAMSQLEVIERFWHYVDAVKEFSPVFQEASATFMRARDEASLSRLADVSSRGVALFTPLCAVSGQLRSLVSRLAGAVSSLSARMRSCANEGGPSATTILCGAVGVIASPIEALVGEGLEASLIKLDEQLRGDLALLEGVGEVQERVRRYAGQRGAPTP